jgi:hypothetical protein
MLSNNIPDHSSNPPKKGSRSPKKDSTYKGGNYQLNLAVANSENYSQQSLSPHSETITIVVMPCGREDGKNSQDEMPYEIKIRKKGKRVILNYIATENSLKEIFLRKP